jgi:hypothetical protein
MIAWLIARPKVIVGAVLVALFAGWTVIAYRHGVKTERADWTERQRIAEAAARQTEHDLADLAAKGAARLAEKERLLNEQAKRSADTIRTLLAGVPECRVPARVGRVLDATAGSVPATAEIPGSISPDPDDPSLGALIGLAETLDTVNENYRRCALNIQRLNGVRDWYEDVRSRVNGP